MYSGSTLTKFSGRVMGAHQKIDRVSRKHLKILCPEDKRFPGIRMILQFEGANGPDGIKRKSPARDEPWHYYDPYDETDRRLITIIEEHYRQLIEELVAGNQERAAFEAAWLAHALTDGLTPAHHFPYEEALIELRGGQAIENRTSLKGKIIIPGDTKAEMLKNNWKMWGGKGLMTTHGTFEWGVASMMRPLSFIDALPSQNDIEFFKQVGITELFKRNAHDIAKLNMYERYYLKGWTPRLAAQVRTKLGPLIIQTVTLAWYGASEEARMRRG